MNAKDKEFYDIVLKNCTEKEIYAILLKKKEIDDKTPKLRTKDDNKLGQDFMGPLQVWPMVCGCRGSKNVTYRQQTTDKKVNTEPL